MNNIDISILEKIPKFDKKVKLIIKPLAPLSMVSELPGAFYKALKTPTKKMLCGLIENIIGWHIDIADRTKIKKELENIRKEQGIPFVDYKVGSTYIPLLIEYFDVVSVEHSERTISYNDLWSKSYRRADADVHPKGTPNISYELIPMKKEKKLIELFHENIGKFPVYYSTPTNREYVEVSEIKYKIILDHSLWTLLKKNLEINNLGYLGNSEGWIHIEVEENG